MWKAVAPTAKKATRAPITVMDFMIGQTLTKEREYYQVGPLLFKTNISPGYICLFRLISHNYKMMDKNFSNWMLTLVLTSIDIDFSWVAIDIDYRSIITRGFYTLYPIFKDLNHLFSNFFALCTVSIQERFLIKSRLWWHAYGTLI